MSVSDAPMFDMHDFINAVMDVSLETKNPFSTVKDQNIRYSQEKPKAATSVAPPKDELLER